MEPTHLQKVCWALGIQTGQGIVSGEWGVCFGYENLRGVGEPAAMSLKDFVLYTINLVNYPQADTERRQSDPNQRVCSQNYI